MKVSLVGILCSLLLSGTALAVKDEYLGDASIYAGLPKGTKSRPNVMLVIDNSRATLKAAPGDEYHPEKSYPPVVGCGGPKNPCYDELSVYEVNNQGGVADKAVIGDYTTLKDSCPDNDAVVFRTLDLRGTYSGAGNANYPLIGAGGSCVTDSNASNGAVYVLGKYLNYAQSGDDTSSSPTDVPEVCYDAPIVKITSTVNSCSDPAFTVAKCKAPNKVISTTWQDFYQLAVTPVTVVDKKKSPPNAFWTSLGKYMASENKYPEATEWSATAAPPYTMPDDLVVEVAGVSKTCAEWKAASSEPSTSNALTQREIIYQALELAVGGAIGSVNFGAMTYGTNNSGGVVLAPLADLSKDVNADESGKVVAPVCDETNTSLPFCQFLAALPGPRLKDAIDMDDTKANDKNYSCKSDFKGAECVNSNTARPQAEAVLDAGYYFKAFPTESKGVLNDVRIDKDIENECKLNHIVLLTNGFTNGDSFNAFNVEGLVGDADGDKYPDESPYGMGSHWLDDVAKRLYADYGITTHTVLAFQEIDALVENAAKDGEGQFFHAYKAEELASQLTKLFAAIINPASTSFVAPVVPASTTNRTVSSNKVYLGLFRPQQNPPWHGNVKKYTVSDADSNQLLGFRPNADDSSKLDPIPATDPFGKFDKDVISYWSLVDGIVPSARGDLDPDGSDPKIPKGDGGEVDAGGVGGVLLKKVETLATAIRADGWEQNTVPWRNIYTFFSDTNLKATGNLFLESNTNLVNETTNPLDLPDDPAKKRLIRYVHGIDTDDSGSAASAEARDWIMGDVLHSRPQVVNYNKYAPAYENSCKEDDPSNHNASVVYVGANDGMLHAFRDCDGEELWAFIPPGALAGLQYFEKPVSGATGHPTFVDGPPSFFKYDANGDGVVDPSTDYVVLIFGQRRGGGVNIIDESTTRGDYYALDVTIPDTPKLLWKLNNVAMGETWGQPMLSKINVSTTDKKMVKEVFFIGGGYDNLEDLRYGNTQFFPDGAEGANINNAAPGGEVDGLEPKTTPTDPDVPARYTSSGTSTTASFSAGTARGRGIYAVEVATFTKDADTGATEVVVNSTPTIFWSYTNPLSSDADIAHKGSNADMAFPFATDLAVLDKNGDGFADRVYAGDTGGNLWRFDLSAAKPDDWSGEILFKSNPGHNKSSLDGSDQGEDGSKGRKIFYPPAIAFFNGAPHVYFGTGDREHPLNRSVTDRMYCVIDWKDAGAPISYPLDEGDLEDVTQNAMQETSTGDAAGDAAAIDALKKRLYSTPTNPYSEGKYSSGWFIKLDGTHYDDTTTTKDPGEKVLAQPEIFGNAVYFNTYKPLVGTKAGCTPGNLGESWGYAVNFKTGEAVQNFANKNTYVNGVNYNNDVNVSDEAAFYAETNERALGGAPGELLKSMDRRRYLGTGIPSGAVIVVDSAGRVKLLMSSSERVSVFEGVSNKDVYPIYWMQW